MDIQIIKSDQYSLIQRLESGVNTNLKEPHKHLSNVQQAVSLRKDIVDISPEAKRKLEEETLKKDTPKKEIPQKEIPQKEIPQKEIPQKEIQRALHNIVNTDEQSNVSNEDDIDKQIKKLQEQIRALMADIKQLQNSDDEASIEQLKMLEAQLVSMNMQLMALYNQKLEQLES